LGCGEAQPSGIGFDRIAATLNGEGVPTRTAGKRWHGFAVNQILKWAVNAEGNRTLTLAA
jgi:hypothetical protein